MCVFVNRRQAQELVSQLMEAQAYSEAFEVAAVASEGGYVGSTGSGSFQRHNSLPAVQSGMANISISDALPSAVRKLQAQVLIDNAKPVHAACCHLSVNDVEGALDKLQRGHEVVLAAALAMATRSPSIDVHIEALARQCEVSHSPLCVSSPFAALSTIPTVSPASSSTLGRAVGAARGLASKRHTIHLNRRGDTFRGCAARQYS